MNTDRNELILSVAIEGFWDWDIKNDRTYLSPRYCELAGYSPDDTIFDSHFYKKIIHPDDRSRVFKMLEEYLEGKRDAFATEYRMIAKDGTVRWIEGRGKIIEYDEHGTPARMAGTIIDVTERKKETTNARFFLRQRAILDNLPMMAWLKDTESHLEMVNEPYAKNCGHSIEECIGKTDFELFPRELAESYIAGDREVISTGRKKQGEAPITTPDGIRWHLYYKTPLYDEQGRVVGTTGIAQDITERKEAEEARAKLEAQLQQAQKMESVGRLAGGVAHDFNNLLTAIIGNAELGLMKSDPTHPLHAYLLEIRKAAERSADLTRQLLAFARKQTIAPKMLNLNETVASMLKMLQRLIGENIDLNWQPEKDLWPVKLDPSQIDQILANLCINAGDAISGVGKITIETGNSSFDENYCAHHAGFVPGEYVLLAVSDNGCGMDKETLAVIFEPFFTTKGFGKGTGLGLATVYGIIKQNNGFINVYSEPGQGTTFRIYLPRYPGEAGQVRTEGVSKPLLRGNETILLVEDEPSILEITREMLEEQGYAVLAANRPDEAIRLAREHAGDIHLLITDVVMPEMNGRDLAKKMLSLNQHLKCLFMSGYTSNVIAHHGVLEEGVHFTQKPFSMHGLATKVREVLDGN